MQLKQTFTLFLFLFLCFLSKNAVAQTDGSTIQTKITTPPPTVQQKQDLDTEESLKYMGSELFFQVKKRLHLTTEEEEKEKEKEKQKRPVSFNILGIKIERG